jgi:hypothetical protein
MPGLPYLIRVVVPTLGLRKPKVPVRGMDVAGTVEAVGPNVTRCQPGDEVFGWCDGSFAEYACAPEDHFAPKPTTLSFEQAGAVPISGFAALQALHDEERSRRGSRCWSSGRRGGAGPSRCSWPRRVARLATQGSNDTIRVKSRQHRGVESSGRRISPVAATVPPLLRCPVAVLDSLVGNRVSGPHPGRVIRRRSTGAHPPGACRGADRAC